MAEMDEEDLTTQQIQVNEWLPPVATVEELPTEGVVEGSLCYVQATGNEAVWQFRGGRWARRPGRPG